MHELVGGLRKDRLRAALFDEPVEERRIGRYRVVGLLGRGGMGTVLEAVDDALERRVALKLLHHDVPARDQGRLLREARALARLSHPNVVQVHEVGELPRPFIAMELVRGRTLAEWQRERPPWRACVRAYLQAGRGLAAVHAQRLVHRDFKPSNCIIDDEGRVRVMDFGLARSLGPRERIEDETTSPLCTDAGAEGIDASLTDSGAVLGTLAYMPLEQLQGREVDARSDQFGFCVALWEALYGERPFAGSTAAALERALASEEVGPPPQGSRVRALAALRTSDAFGVRRPPTAVRRVLLRGLAADPARRWPAMDELLAALERRVRPRWRGRVALGTVLVGLGLAGASVWHELALRQACTGVESQLVGAWDASRRETLRDALLGSPLPYARAAWEGVEPRLDAYAEAWVAASHEVCEEARVRQEQPESVLALRSACLHERRVALREAVEVLVGAEPLAVERAVGLVAQLPGLERCADVGALLAAVPPPEDPRVRDEVQARRDELIEARALRQAARHADSLAVIERVASQAADLDYAPLAAEVALGRGWALYGQGRLDLAVTAFEDAYTRGAGVGHDAVAAEAATMLSFIVGERQAKHEVGLKWALTARAHALRPAADPGAEAMALSNEGAILSRHGDFEQALDRYERAVALQERATVENEPLLAFTLNGLGVVHTALDEVDEAAACHQRALELRRTALGPDHPYVAMSLNNLGVVAERRGRSAEALAYFRQALAIKEANLGPTHPELASSLSNLGSLLYRASEHDEARAMFERSLAIIEGAEGPSSVQLGPVLANLALVQLERRQLPEAEASLLRSLALAEQAHGPDHPDRISMLTNLAHVARERGDHAAALRYAERALAVADRASTPDGEMRAMPLLAKGLVELDLGHDAVAAELASMALRQLEAAGAPAQRTVPARLLWGRALVALEPPRIAEALRILEEARASLEPLTDVEAARLRGEVEGMIAELRRRDPPR